jgi:OmpA-OmpF porin, OOP family
MFSVPTARIDGLLRLSGGLVASYAHRPLVLAVGPDAERHDLVDHQLIMHAWTGIEVERRLHVYASAPVILSQGGDSPVVAGPASPTAFGDMRIGARLALPEPGPSWPEVSLGVELWLPTGDTKAYAGSDTVRVAPRLTLSGGAAAVWWASSFATRLAPEARSSLYGSELEVAAAGGVALGPVRVGPELVARLALRDEQPRAPGGHSMEARLGATATLGAWVFGVAAGPGIGVAPGTPELRVLAGVALAFDVVHEPATDARPAPHASGASSEASKAPDASTVTPAPGAAGGIASKVPPVTEEATTPGAPVGEPVAGGDPCPSASAGIAENQGGSHEPCAAAPVTELAIVSDRIVVLEPIRFLVGAPELDPSSSTLLDRIAALIQAHPELGRVAVDGHTDGRGNPLANLALSRRRAVSVMNALIERGVDPRRLEARGFGPTRPIAEETTEEGRAKNRRVEFVVRRRSQAGSDGWVDGTID